MKKHDKKPVVPPNELMMMRMCVKNMRDKVCEDLDGLLARLDAFLPDETAVEQRYKNFKKEDWKDFLES